MLPATALALLITGCAQQTLHCSNKPAAVAPKEPSPIISSFLELGRRKLVDAAKICGGAENVYKNRNPANIRQWIVWFYYFRHLYPLEACVLLTIIAWVAHRIWATLSALLINILLSSSSCFCIVISPEGEIIPFSGVWSGRPHYPRRRRWWLHALIRQTALMCKTDDDQRSDHQCRASYFSFQTS